MTFRNVIDVARWRLCVGCGACVFACEQGNIGLKDVPGDGLRPVLLGSGCEECGKCLRVCPGIGMAHNGAGETEQIVGRLRSGWGPILEVWEGYAADPEIRLRGSSGGAATALALYCLQSGLAGSVLHIGQDDKTPWRNRTVMSRSREELLARTGSRYSPASPCEGLAEVARSPLPSVFIGKPCDIQGLRKAQAVESVLRDSVALSIGIFCAGTPSTSGLMDLLEMQGVHPGNLEEIRFRGHGWPGSFAVRLKGEGGPSSLLSYEDSWSMLQAYRPFRCHLCPDGTSEFADISCGDPWYRKIEEGEPGHSLCLVRTAKGAEIIRGAIRNGYVTLARGDGEVLGKSQSNLLNKRRAIWGRILALRLLGIPAPRLDGFNLFENWRGLSLKDKMRSILGTARRVVKRRYYLPLSWRSDSASHVDRKVIE